MAKISNTSTNSKIPKDKPLPCKCGTEPVIITTVGVLSKSPMIGYQCPQCKNTVKIFWSPKQSENAIGSWNLYILEGR